MPYFFKNRRNNEHGNENRNSIRDRYSSIHNGISLLYHILYTGLGVLEIQFQYF
jgi:hypothetical protein